MIDRNIQKNISTYILSFILFCTPFFLMSKDGAKPITVGEAKFSLKDSVIYLPKNSKNFTLKLKGNFSKHWGIYGLSPVVDEDGFGPQATEITVTPDSTFKIEGKIKSGKSYVHYDPEYKMDVEKFKESVDFTIPVSIESIPESGKITGKISILYQLCADASCTTPNDYTRTFTVYFKDKKNSKKGK